jgi:hypothetical protein
MEIEIVKESYVTVTWDSERSMGKVVWSGSPTPEQYKKAFLSLLDHAKKGNKVSRFLSDTRNQGIVNPENRKWFEKEMVPAAIKSGLKRTAVITNGNAFKRYYINMILSAANKFNVPFKIVSTEQEAIDFLMIE